ncbi:hypothetical protein DPEC_G00353610 [Dallia pectoralis]|uniref:Uncharacterized protein n=1 Tax=Dallia pectoralis TaxID=75939 RepID=A0ACC2F2M7_DALPE|nr:hypothetical protein DPEC_G00353610 [Dallia pectoralis]
MAEKWLDAASRQVTMLSGRLNALLSTGLDRLHSDLGVDLGVKPEIPPWVILLAACIGLLLMVALWASACRGLFKKRSPRTGVDEAILSPGQAAVKAGRAEEQKKKKRKVTEKKSQPNGRAIVEEEVRVTEEDDLPHDEVKTENTSEVKKTKKKEKQPLKKVKKATSGVKEPEEGSWETKVSNKEKREQRRKDKTPGDGSGSPEGLDLLPCIPSEKLKASPKAAAPVSGSVKKEKKKKGDSLKTKAEKADVATAIGTAYAVSSDETPTEGLVGSAEWTDLAVAPEAPVLTAVPKEGHWTSPEATIPTGKHSHRDTAVWGQETEGGWTVIDAEIKTSDVRLVSCGGLGVAVKPQPESQWMGHAEHQPEDHWSGLNGRSSAELDSGSDWNAPAEVWGNYEEPLTVETSAQEEPQPVMMSDKEEEAASDVTGKSKKKKKKKKKQTEDSAVPVQESEEPIAELVSQVKVKKQPIGELLTQVKVKKQPIQGPAAVEAKVEKPVVVQKKTLPTTQVPPQPAVKEATKQNSVPAPPKENSVPAPPKQKSVPAPPKENSLPAPPKQKSVPAPPKENSLPAPPKQKSVPAPPKENSLPAPPKQKSVPAPPKENSLPAPPKQKSVPAPPKENSVPAPPKQKSVPAPPKENSVPAPPKQKSVPAPPKQKSVPAPPKENSVPAPPKQNILPAPPKQNSLPAPTQKTSEESQPSKPVTKKKRARRET